MGIVKYTPQITALGVECYSQHDLQKIFGERELSLGLL